MDTQEMGIKKRDRRPIHWSDSILGLNLEP